MTPTHRSGNNAFSFAWNVAGVVLRHATGAVLIAFSVIMIVALCKSAVPADAIGSKVFHLLLDVLSAILLIPLQIIVYRLIIFGELPSRYRAYFSTHFRAYFTWATIFWLPTLVGEILPKDTTILFVWYMVSAIAGIVAAIRLAVLFPALATTNDVTFWDAWRDTQGRVWTIILLLLPVVIVLIGISVALMGIVVLLAMTGINGLPFWKFVVTDAITAVVALIAVVIATANTAFIFNVIGERVKRGTKGQHVTPIV